MVHNMLLPMINIFVRLYYFILTIIIIIRAFEPKY